MRGIQALFVRRDEVEEAWKWVDSITDGYGSMGLLVIFKAGQHLVAGPAQQHIDRRRATPGASALRAAQPWALHTPHAQRASAPWALPGRRRDGGG